MILRFRILPAYSRFHVVDAANIFILPPKFPQPRAPRNIAASLRVNPNVIDVPPIIDRNGINPRQDVISAILPPQINVSLICRMLVGIVEVQAAVPALLADKPAWSHHTPPVWSVSHSHLACRGASKSIRIWWTAPHSVRNVEPLVTPCHVIQRRRITIPHCAEIARLMAQVESGLDN